MIEVTVQSIRVSLINQNRLVVLSEKDSPRYLSIWIGGFEADAITVGLQGAEVPRPLTHDLMCMIIGELGAELERVEVRDLRDDTFYADLVLTTEGGTLRVDARPSDAIALAVRRGVPIFVSEEVMEQAGQLPAPEHEIETDGEREIGEAAGGEEDGGLDIFRDFIDSSLDLSDLGQEEDD